MSTPALAVPNSTFSLPVTNVALPHASPSPSRSRSILSTIPIPPRSAPPILNSNSLFHVAEEDDDSDLDTPIDPRPIDAQLPTHQTHNIFYADPSYSKIIANHSPAPRVRRSSPPTSPYDSAISEDEDDDGAFGVNRTGSDLGDGSSDRIHLSIPAPLIRSGSVGNSWGISGVGRGFADWTSKEEEAEEEEDDSESDEEPEEGPRSSMSINRIHSFGSRDSSANAGDRTDNDRHRQIDLAPPSSPPPPLIMDPIPPSRAIDAPQFMHTTDLVSSPTLGYPYSGNYTPALSLLQAQLGRAPPLLRSQTLPLLGEAALSASPDAIHASLGPFSTRPNSPRSASGSIPNSPRLSRRRDLQKRISLVAGRVVPVPPLIRPLEAGPSRWPSSSSLASAPPPEKLTSAGSNFTGEEKTGRSIEDFMIVGEAGRGAYGLVKRVKEIRDDGTLGPPLIMKQVIKSRILADCWKKHPVHGTIPIEIYVMSALSSSQYILPPVRPWDPMRFSRPVIPDVASLSLDETPRAGSLGGSTPSSRDSSRASTSTSESGSVAGTSVTSLSSTSTSGDAQPISQRVVSAVNHVHMPSRRSSLIMSTLPEEEIEKPWHWREGAIHKGHPSIIPLLEFFEDAHFYYLILPATNPSFPSSPFPTISLTSGSYLQPSPTSTPVPLPDSLLFHGSTPPPPPAKFPSDLFDLVEKFPTGLPAPLIRGYLGQIADALAFLHTRGICHRDIKDENVVLSEDGRCWLIDFGSSGVVRKNGWDTFSGTLDYAGPEILRGERYAGPPQDIWAFGIVSYVLVTGECPFSSAAEADIGLVPNSKALLSLEERCGLSPPSSDPLPDDAAPIRERTPEDDTKSEQGKEADGGGRLGDAMALIKACLQLDVARRPSFERIMGSRYLSGKDGWVDLADIEPGGGVEVSDVASEGTTEATERANGEW